MEMQVGAMRSHVLSDILHLNVQEDTYQADNSRAVWCKKLDHVISFPAEWLSSSCAFGQPSQDTKLLDLPHLVWMLVAGRQHDAAGQCMSPGLSSAHRICMDLTRSDCRPELKLIKAQHLRRGACHIETGRLIEQSNQYAHRPCHDAERGPLGACKQQSVFYFSPSSP